MPGRIFKDGAPWGAGDWVGPDRARISGQPVGLSSLSGGRLTRALLIGQARRRDIPIRAERRMRWAAVRVALLWVPVCWLAWWWVQALFGQLPGHQDYAGFATSEVLALLIAVSVWVEDRLQRTSSDRLVSEAQTELEALGWQTTCATLAPRACRAPKVRANAMTAQLPKKMSELGWRQQPERTKA